MNYETEYYMDGSVRSDKALWGTTTPVQPDGGIRSDQTNWGTTTTPVEPLIAERRQQKPGFSASLDRFLDDAWGLELLAWFISAIFMAAIIATCMMNNGKSLANWPFSITINNLIAVFSQIGQTVLAIPVSACMAQLKWLWFTKEQHPLDDFGAIESASHSPRSSLLFLFQKRALSLASLSERRIASGNSTISTLGNITRASLQGENPVDYNGVGGGKVMPGTIAAIYNGMTSTPSLLDITPKCSTTGNCTFEPYHSLSIFSYPVANLTSQINITSITKGADCSVWGTGSRHMCKYSLPNGMEFQGIGEFLNISTASSNPTLTSTLTSMSYSNNTILDFFVVYYSAALNSVQAMEGKLKFCGQTYNTSVISAQTKTNIIDSWGALDMTYSTPRASGPPIYPLIGGQSVLSVDQDVFTAMGVALDQVFQRNWAESDDGNQFFLTPNGSISTAAQVLSILLFNKTEPIAALQNFTNKLSIALTNNLRTGTDSTTVEGTFYSLEIYLSVRWDWFILPVFLIAAAFFFLIVTMIQTKRRGTGVWKSSPLVTMAVLGRDAKAELGLMTDFKASALNEAAEGLLVKMRPDVSGWSLEKLGS
ncbi:hypothetical protein NA56DRAFT_752676 [Hyaloscypha hepaticicola]|uniref:Uncharacterized protein n=1 Tax=Hyaloscypha hepaticicola TaxID=2082293 RepID=A0A2J6PSQ7_9HELO|nr:hypothetical protein NA56DRAFT_752676 [Hyaloscypha hepaticicola]